MAITLTAAPYVRGARHNTGAPTLVQVDFNSGATVFGSAGDSLLIAKLPNRAKIADLAMSGIIGATSMVGNVLMVNGAGGSGTVTLITSLSAAAAGTLHEIDVGNLGARVSITDTVPTQYASLIFVAMSGTKSTSFILRGRCLYDVDNNDAN